RVETLMLRIAPRRPLVQALAVDEQGVARVRADAHNRGCGRAWKLDCPAKIDVRIPRAGQMILHPAPFTRPLRCLFHAMLDFSILKSQISDGTSTLLSPGIANTVTAQSKLSYGSQRRALYHLPDRPVLSACRRGRHQDPRTLRMQCLLPGYPDLLRPAVLQQRLPR